MVYGGQTSLEHEGLSRGRRNGPDENRAVIPASTFRSIYGNEFVNHLLVRPRNVADAGVGVANIMYVVVRERTQEIGIKLAVGARRRHIVNQFMFEAILIAVGGGLLGLAVASLLVIGIDSVPSENPALEYIMNPKLSLPIASTCVGLLMVIGLVAGILPARKAARLDPVESLRYE